MECLKDDMEHMGCLKNYNEYRECPKDDMGEDDSEHRGLLEDDRGQRECLKDVGVHSE